MIIPVKLGEIPSCGFMFLAVLLKVNCWKTNERRTDERRASNDH